MTRQYSDRVLLKSLNEILAERARIQEVELLPTRFVLPLCRVISEGIFTQSVFVAFSLQLIGRRSVPDALEKIKKKFPRLRRIIAVTEEADEKHKRLIEEILLPLDEKAKRVRFR